MSYRDFCRLMCCGGAFYVINTFCVVEKIRRSSEIPLTIIYAFMVAGLVGMTVGRKVIQN